MTSGFPMLLRELSLSAAHVRSRRLRLWCAIGQFVLAGWFLIEAKSGDGSRLFALLVGAEFAIIYAVRPALIASHRWPRDPMAIRLRRPTIAPGSLAWDHVPSWRFVRAHRTDRER